MTEKDKSLNGLLSEPSGKDESLKKLLSKPEVFADIINCFLYHVPGYIKPENLVAAPTGYISRSAEDGILHRSYRDIAMLDRSEEITYGLYGTENEDRYLSNIAFIKAVDGIIRVAPYFDFTESFRFCKIGDVENSFKTFEPNPFLSEQLDEIPSMFHNRSLIFNFSD